MANRKAARSSRKNENAATAIPESESATTPSATESPTVEPKPAIAEQSRIEHVPLARITQDERLVCRANGVNADTVAEYASRMKEGAQFERVVLFHDEATDVLWLADGNHRFRTAEKASLTEIFAEIRPGDRHDALAYAATANDKHGLLLTNMDKRFIVGRFLDTYKRQPARWTAEKCGVSHTFVSNMKSERVATVATGGLATVASSDEAPEGADGIARRHPKLDAERETAKLGKRLETIAKGVGDNTEAKPRLATLLIEHGQALGGVAQKAKGVKGAKAANGAATAEVVT